MLLYVNAISRWLSFWCAERCFCYVCSKSGNCMEVRTPTAHLLRTQKQICYTVTSIWWSRGGTGKFALPYTLDSETWGAPGCREARFAYMECWEVRTPMHPSTPLLIRYQSRKFLSVLEFWGCAWDNVIYEQKLKQKRLDKKADILQMTYANAFYLNEKYELSFRYHLRFFFPKIQGNAFLHQSDNPSHRACDRPLPESLKTIYYIVIRWPYATPTQNHLVTLWLFWYVVVFLI